MTRLRRPCLPLLMLLAFALLARGLAPAGWMPTFSAGGIRIMLCTGYGPATTIADVTGHADMGEPQQKGHHDPCPYALALAKAWDLPPVIAEALPPVTPAPAIGAELAAVRLVASLRLRPPARGPPHRA